MLKHKTVIYHVVTRRPASVFYLPFKILITRRALEIILTQCLLAFASDDLAYQACNMYRLMDGFAWMLSLDFLKYG